MRGSLTHVRVNLIHSFFDANMNLVQYALSGTYDADKPVLIDGHNPSRTLSRARATSLVSRLAGSFPEDSTVCIHLANDILYPVLVLSILASGCCYTSSHITYTQPELEHHLRKSEAKYIVTSSDHLRVVVPAVNSVGGDIEIIRFTDVLQDEPKAAPEGQESLRTLHDLVKNVEEMPLEERLKAISSDSVAKLTATSGSTGLPKLAVGTHRMAVAECNASEDRSSAKSYDVRRLYCLPIYHAFPFPEMMINSLRLGFTSYYLKRFGDAFPHLVNDYEITEVMVVPSMLVTIGEQASEDIDAKADLQRLKLILCAGAPLAESLRVRFLSMFHDTPKLIQAYGTSECGWISTFSYEDPDGDDATSVGRLTDAIQVRVSDEHVTNTSDGGRAAELWIKGPQVMSGYRSDPDLTSSTLTDDGWLKTGDIAQVDDSGKIFLVGRAKDIIKVDGHTIAPIEIESVLSGSTGVKDTVVLASQKGEDEHPVVFVVPRTSEGDNVTSATIRKILSSKLAKHKVAKCEIKFVEEIPRNENGKVLKQQLLKHFEK
ncbi:hypothetical protein AC579_6080 [Pseudocercospora musae]|uniref:AMP-dependent synthetase/ligase domain-containing protein n=1 Tax=Pseudocercospora musae TaxID=113226 RepID=A0A139IAP9_9PEZI|nr:hypothetical protein AC579_6080 [Pseudocercospora musae]